MSKEYFVNEGGIIGSQDGTINTKSEEFKMLQKAILEHASKQTPRQKLEIKLTGLRFRMEDYLEEKQPKQILNAGYFLKDILNELKIKNTAFAEYLGLTKTNFSALIHGKRKLNADLAIKLGHVFKIEPDIWINIENKSRRVPDSEYRIKNELLEIKKENREKYKKYKPQDLLSRK